MEKFFSGLQCGSISLRQFCVTPAGRIDPESTEITFSPGQMHLQSIYADGSRDEIYFKKTSNGIIAVRDFKTADAVQIVELGLDIKNIAFNAPPAEDYFYHNENPRIYQRMTFPVDFDRVHDNDARDSGFDETAGNRWADPGVIHERIGRSPYQPFPAILLSNYKSCKGLVHGTLSQKLFYHNYLVKHAEDGTLLLSVFSGFKSIAALNCPAGKHLTDKWYLGSTDNADDIELIFEKYTSELRKHLPPMYGATKLNRDNMVWGSWNDGISRKVNEAMVLKEARYLKENFPTVRWIQLDDGYAVNVPPAHGLGCIYEKDYGINKEKFPNGLRKYADAVRAIGLRPAVWIGGFCPKYTPIYQEHPEWFVNYDYRVESSAPLDVSIPEVREYMEHALDVFFAEFGFEGMKHDFWSYSFEDSHDLLKIQDHSGYEWRDWWLKEVRKRLPSDGYFQTGCDIVMGNPFLGEFFTNYRYGIDIGSGHWDYVKTNFLWGTACFALHTGDLFVPNSDSVGLFPGLNDTDALFALNYCIASASMVEIAGKLSEADQASERLARLKKAVCNPCNGKEVFLGNYNYRDPEATEPQIIYFKSALFSNITDCPALPVRTAGLFNTAEEPLQVKVSLESLKLDNGSYIVTDIWSRETVKLDADNPLNIELPGHGSRLLSVSIAGEAKILDGNMRINSCSGNALEFDYAGTAELLMTFKPEKIAFEGDQIEFTAEKKGDFTAVKFTVPGAGTVEII